MEIFLNPLKLTLSNIYQLCGTSSPFSHTETFPRLIYFFILKTHHLGDLDTQMNRVGCQGDIGVKSLNGLTCIAHLQSFQVGFEVGFPGSDVTWPIYIARGGFQGEVY